MGVTFSSSVRLDYIENIDIGDGSSIGQGVRLQASNGAKIRIGNRCKIAQRVLILTATHDPNVLPIGKVGLNKPVIIGDDVWIGAGAILLPGITVGDRVVIGAGSIVTKDCVDDTLYCGNPAMKIRNLQVSRESTNAQV